MDRKITGQEALEEWLKIIEKNRSVFFKKNIDYGTAWLVLRPKSLTDQIFIKAQRIRTLQETKVQKVIGAGNDIASEFAAIINYSTMGLMKLKLTANEDKRTKISTEELTPLFEEAVSALRRSFLIKRLALVEIVGELQLSSLNDLILENILRLKGVEEGTLTFTNEGPDAMYTNCANFAILALIRMQEEIVES